MWIFKDLVCIWFECREIFYANNMYISVETILLSLFVKSFFFTLSIFFLWWYSLEFFAGNNIHVWCFIHSFTKFCSLLLFYWRFCFYSSFSMLFLLICVQTIFLRMFLRNIIVLASVLSLTVLLWIFFSDCCHRVNAQSKQISCENVNLLFIIQKHFFLFSICHIFIASKFQVHQHWTWTVF